MSLKTMSNSPPTLIDHLERVADHRPAHGRPARRDAGNAERLGRALRRSLGQDHLALGADGAWRTSRRCSRSRIPARSPAGRRSPGSIRCSSRPTCGPTIGKLNARPRAVPSRAGSGRPGWPDRAGSGRCPGSRMSTGLQPCRVLETRYHVTVIEARIEREQAMRSRDDAGTHEPGPARAGNEALALLNEYTHQARV